MFKIKSSKRSNNGTDVGSGQIPELLYKIPEIEQEDGVQIQLLDRDFSCTVSPVCCCYLLFHFFDCFTVCVYKLFVHVCCDIFPYPLPRVV